MIVALLISILVSLPPTGPRPVPVPVVPPTTAPAGRIAPATFGGVVGYAVPALGARYLAMRLPRGTHVRICGAAGCVNRVVNDYGPSRRIYPERIADLSWNDFGRVCGDHAMGLCRATAYLIEVPPKLPRTDTE